MGCNSIEIESDCSFAVAPLQLMDEYLGQNVTVIIEQMAMEFRKSTNMHRCREANQVAD